MKLRAKVQKWNHLSSEERYLFRRAFCLLMVSRIGVRFLSFERTRRILEHKLFSSPDRASHPPASLEARVRAIHRARTVVPGATCLVVALSGQALLRSGGYNAQLRIGVGNREGTVVAHAWVELDGKPILGEWDAESYQPLPLF